MLCSLPPFSSFCLHLLSSPIVRCASRCLCCEKLSRETVITKKKDDRSASCSTTLNPESLFETYFDKILYQLQCDRKNEKDLTEIYIDNRLHSKRRVVEELETIK